MSRSTLAVADIFRARDRHGAGVNRGQLKVMSAYGDLGLRSASATIENCRTAALDAHVAHRESLTFGDISVPDQMDDFPESSQLGFLTAGGPARAKASSM